MMNFIAELEIFAAKDMPTFALVKFDSTEVLKPDD